MNRKVIAGPAGHWYALYEGTNDPDTPSLVGLPMMRDDRTRPAHPNTLDAPWEAGWYDITDPAPGCDDQALIAELSA